AACSSRSSDLRALDRKALEVGDRIFRIEDLAVEEGLLAARGGGRNVGGWDVQFLGGLAPDVLAVDLADQRLGVGAGLELAPADILGEEPEVMALERVGGMLPPVLHDMRRVFDDFSGNAVVELSFDA